MASLRRAAAAMQSNGISRLLARRIEGMAFPLQRVAFPAIQHRSSFARHDLLPRCSRAFHAAAPVRSGEGMSEGAFTRLVDDCLEDLYGNLEAFVEDLGLPDSDISMSQGVLTVNLGRDRGTFVINKQTPNRQIWLSSPVSGPFRYDYRAADRSWRYSRDGHALHEKLRKELEKLTGADPGEL